jgi:hypothetical protein
MNDKDGYLAPWTIRHTASLMRILWTSWLIGLAVFWWAGIAWLATILAAAAAGALVVELTIHGIQLRRTGRSLEATP